MPGILDSPTWPAPAADDGRWLRPSNSRGAAAMPEQGNYILIARMDVDPDKEDLFNEIYDTEHIPSLLKVPGVYSVERFTQEPLTFAIGKEVRTVVTENEPKYSAIYWIEGPEVLISDEWGAAVEEGRWAEHVRPHTHNRHHILRKRMG